MADHGAVISGYVVPDSFSGHSNIVVRHDGRDIMVRPADELRLDLSGLIDVGRHESGACGFTIDDSAAPGLGDMEDLEIYDAETRTLLYRRRRPHHVAKKILRLESHLFPLWRLDEALNSHFQYSVNRIDSLGRETTTQLLLPYDIGSVFVSGRIFYNTYRLYIESIFNVMFIMHHPLEELAERLIILGQITRTGNDVLSIRDNMSMRSAMDFARSLALHDERALARQLRNIPDDVARILANPVTRQLTTSSPDEMPSKRAVSTALDVLASFALVGLRRSPRIFLDGLAEFAGVDAGKLPPLNNLPGVTPLAQVLKRTRAADGLLEHDLELYAHIANAYKKSAQPKTRTG